MEAHERADTLARENAALRKRVEELEQDIRIHDTRRWLSSCTPAERSEVAFYADVEGFKTRAEKAERERDYEQDRMLVCSVCGQGYFMREAFDLHGCSDAY